MQNVPATADLVDLALAGVRWEIMDSDWQPPVTPTAVVPAMATPEVRDVEVAPPAEAVAAAGPAGWTAGDPGGVTVVMAEPGPVTGVAWQLLQAMLKAVGLGEAPVWQVGVGGTPEALWARVQAGAPQRILVLGQGAVQAVWPTAAGGVEGWFAAPQGWPDAAVAVPVGVTYPPGLVARQPLYKKSVWRHLCAWRAGF